MAPPSNARSGDGRLVDGLRARRRGVAAQIYDVYGTRLFGYASGLLGDDDLAGRAVRAALLAARASPDSVPGPERLRAWLYALVRAECLNRLGDRPVDEEVPLEPGRLIFHYAVASSDDLVLESAHLTLRHGLGTRELAEVLGNSAQQATDLKARLNAAAQGPVSDDDLGLPSEGAASSLPPTTPPPSAPVRPANSPPAKPGDPPPSKPPSKPPAKPPEGPNQAAAPAGGPCRESLGERRRLPGRRRSAVETMQHHAHRRRRHRPLAVASVNEGIAEVDASGSGTLASGQSTTVTVTIRPTVRCYASGFGSGSIGFAPGGSAGISYTCW